MRTLGMLAAAEVSSLDYPGPAWSPYVAGACIGVLAWLTFGLAGKPIGASSAYATLAGLLGKRLAPRRLERLPYYREHPPALTWGLVFVLATVAGGFVAAWTGGELTGRYLPSMWADRFGADSWVLRTAVGFCGGALIAFGARLAGGCTSGHGISGTLQLAVSSWVSLAAFFAGGIATAWLLYRTGGP
jgi:uncharacterized membrane protein YedE/YeeE